MVAPRRTVAMLLAAAATILVASRADAGAGNVTAHRPITDPSFEPRVGADVRPAPGLFHEPGVLFVNFDGAQMQSCNGSDWPVNNCSTVMSDVVLPFSGNAATRAAVVQAMSNDVEDFALSIVDARPPDDVEYDMVMVGNWEPAAEGGFAGIAPTIDCWNNTRGETAFSLDLGDASLVAKIIGQEAAHVWGLEHVDSASDLLYPTVGGVADPSFEDECRQIVVIDGGIVASEANCPDMHASNCDTPDTQNSYRDLLMVFGPPTADVLAPTLEILAPVENEHFASGADFDLTLRMIDDVPPQLFDVFASTDADEQGSQLGNSQWGPELTLPVSGLPDGMHFIRIDIADQQGNFATATVHFEIGGAGDSSGGDSSSGGGDDTTAAGTSTAEPAEGTSAATTSAGDSGADAESSGSVSVDGGDSGCACTPARGPSSHGWMIAMLLARRRRIQAQRP